MALPKDISSFLFLFKVPHLWLASEKHQIWTEMGVKRLPVPSLGPSSWTLVLLPVSSVNVRGRLEEKRSTDRVSQKGVGFTSRNNVILQQHGVQISISQGGGAPSSKAENLKTSKCFMLRVNIWFLNRIPTPSETERNSGLCPRSMNVPYSATLQRNKEETWIGIKAWRDPAFVDLFEMWRGHSRKHLWISVHVKLQWSKKNTLKNHGEATDYLQLMNGFIFSFLLDPQMVSSHQPCQERVWSHPPSPALLPKREAQKWKSAGQHLITAYCVKSTVFQTLVRGVGCGEGCHIQK